MKFLSFVMVIMFCSLSVDAQDVSYGRNLNCETWFDDGGFVERVSKRQINENHYILDTTFLIDHREIFTVTTWRDSLGIPPDVTFVSGTERIDDNTGLTYITYQQYLCDYLVEGGEVILGLVDCFVASIQGNVIPVIEEDCEILSSTDSLIIVDSLRAITGQEQIEVVSYEVVLASTDYAYSSGQCSRVVVPGVRVGDGESNYLVSANGDLLRSRDQKLLKPAPTPFGTYDVSGVPNGSDLCTYVESSFYDKDVPVMVRDIASAVFFGCPAIDVGCPSNNVVQWTDNALEPLLTPNFPGSTTLDLVRRSQVCIEQNATNWPPDPNAIYGSEERDRVYTAFAFSELVYEYFSQEHAWDGPDNNGSPIRLLSGIDQPEVFGFVLNNGTQVGPNRPFYHIHLTQQPHAYPGTIAHEFMHLILLGGLEYLADDNLAGMMHEGLAYVFQSAFLDHIGFGTYQPNAFSPWLTHFDQVFLDLNTSHKNGTLWLTVSQLLSQGGTNNGVTVPAIGFQDMRWIWFETVRLSLANGMTIPQFADALVLRAETLFGPCSPQVESTVLALQSVGLATDWGETRLIGPGPLCAELNSIPGSWPPQITISTSHNYNCAGQVTEWRFPYGWVNAQNIPNGQFGNWSNHVTFIAYPSNTPPYYPKSYTVKAKVDGRWIRRTIRFRDCYGSNDDPDPCNGVAASPNTYDPRFLNASDRISLLPNPVTDVLNTFTFDGLSLNYRIISMDGTVVQSGVVSGDAYLDLGYLEEGMYILYDVDHLQGYRFVKL